MNKLMVLCAAVLAGSALAAETYKWVDERGVTNYGEKPPAGQMAQAAAPKGMSFETFVRLENGMSEGELVLRAGPPDAAAVENFRNDIVKSYYYYPTSSNPRITVVTLRRGRIVNIERERKTF